MAEASFRVRVAYSALLVAVLGMAVVEAQQQEQQQESCPLDCGRHGVCVLGEADFLDHPTEEGGDPILAIHQETSRGGFHCQCESGFTGLQCNVEFQSCSAVHKCYNGGDCVEGLVDKYGNDQHWCDCKNAVDQDGNAFVGKYCEHQAANYCDGEGSFCIEGQCNPDYLKIIGESGPMCLCNEGHGGEHCQYAKGTVPECILECQNGGHCVLGELPLTNITDAYHFGDAMSENREDMQHCLCRDGYDGELCQRKKETCGEGHCLWGAQCIEKIGTDGSPHYHCDCATAEMDVAGQYCQYEKTTHCGVSDFDGKNLFCTNSGACKANIYEGCDCPSGFSGFSCQYKTHDILASASSSSTASTTTLSTPTTPTATPSAPDSGDGKPPSSNKEGTSICTREQDWGPGKPLSFCLNYGQCKAEVTAEDPHAGCECASSSWRGPHCEIHVAPEESTGTPPLATSSSKAVDANVASSGDSNMVVLEVFLLSLSLVLFVAVVLSCFSIYLQRQKKQRAMAESAQFASHSSDEDSYRDEPNIISPHRDSVTDPFPRRLYSSSSDPFASLIAAQSSDSTRQASRAPNPIMVIPPNEEDGENNMTPVEIC